MPNFKITDPVSGRAVTVSGDTPPSQEDAEQIFGAAGFRSQNQPTDKPMSWSEVGSSAIANLPGSAWETAKGMVQPIIHPIKTAKSLYHTAVGEGEKLAGVNGADTAYADSLNSYIADRYGSMEGFKKAVAKDPAGVATDISALFTGGEMALPKLGAAGARAGKVSGALATATNPLALAVKGAGKVSPYAGKVASHTLGFTAGVGARPVEEAFNAADIGGQTAKVFIDNMKGKAPLEEVVQSARNAVEAMKVDRQAAYKAGRAAAIGGNVKPLNFAPIDAALQKTATIGMDTSGTIETIPGARQVHKVISDTVDQWRQNPALRTAENFDDMKKAINNLQYHGELKNLAGPGTPGSVIVREMRDAISKEIATQAPDYAKVMKDYGEASDALDEVNRGLSLKESATVDTALKKLQSVMRDNVATSYGYRGKLAEKLDAKAGGKVMPALAGQALNPPEPRGIIGKRLASDEILAGFFNPKLWAALPFSSPRVIGNLAYGAGAAKRHARNLGLNRALKSAAARGPLAYEIGKPSSLDDALNQQ